VGFISQAPAEAMKPVLADPAFRLTFEIGKVEVARSGDIGYATGPYQMTYTNPVTKKVIEDKGNYVEVYKKQADGSWKSKCF
jgi:ketosteroid isomerase-like protein